MRAVMYNRAKKLSGTIRERIGSEQAFSIAELMIATILLFVLTFAALNFSDQGTSLAKASISSGEVGQELRENSEMMTRQIRAAYYFDPSLCTASAISFVSYAKGDTTRCNVAFQLNGSVLQTSVVDMQVGAITVPAKIWVDVTKGVESLIFKYYNSDGVEIPSPINTALYPTAADPPKNMQVARVDVYIRIGRDFTRMVGTSSEGHRLEKDNTTMKAEGTESVAIRNILTDVP